MRMKLVTSELQRTKTQIYRITCTLKTNLSDTFIFEQDQQNYYKKKRGWRRQKDKENPKVSNSLFTKK
ncbi:hypothetical protein ERO13_D07G149625v2 [Gossypium hirsutum]|uniref:Uncharacterized protein n=2 Tax=Gossypium TaxID=3633 RepID=A0A5J5QT98_GOSBA|nr:hypothetical protein ES319_D07G161500v1 [Gossypium barbadense]KAG4138694.1 hypothetical protein ERO13_D07G149625v2 [Gossypium hirsutum]TYI73948.1 hypothetical protein E1A91_D07G164900v1 [Gossypium mustelinum]